MLQPGGASAPMPCTVTTNVLRFGVHSEYVVPELLPLKAYSASFHGIFQTQGQAAVEREVHRYVFQTSRYADFAEQIGSYRLRDGSGKCCAKRCSVLLPLPAGLAAAGAVVTGTLSATDSLAAQYADLFDRLTTGALQMEALDPPAGTEFNLLRLGPRILGILVRNPEPFNDPKLPAALAADTVELSIDGGPASAFSVIHAKDLAAAILTNADGSLDLPGGSYSFTFRYKQFDGAAYITVATENVVLEVA